MKASVPLRLLFCLVIGPLPLSQTSCNNREQHPTISTTSGTTTEQFRVEHHLPDSATIKAMLTTADSLRYKSQDSAKVLYQEVAHYGMLLKYNTAVAMAYERLGQIHRVNGSYDSAIYYFRQSLPYARKLSPQSGIYGGIYTDMAWVYYYQMQLDSAARFMYKGVEILETQQTKEVTGYRNAYDVYKNMCGFWINMNNWEVALPYMKKAEDMAVLLNDSAILMDALYIKASVYQKRGFEDSAIRLYEQILQHKQTPVATRIQVHYSMGTMYALRTNKDDLEKGISHFTEGLQLLRRDFTHHISELRFLFGLAVAYNNLGDIENNKAYTLKAEAIFLTIDTMPAKTSLAEDLIHLYQNLAVIEASKGRYQTAFVQSQKAIKMRDSLYRQEQLDMISKMEFGYRIANKDKLLIRHQLQIAQQQNKIQQQYLLIGGTTLASLVLLAVGIIFFRHKRKLHAAYLSNLEKDKEIGHYKAMLQGEEQERSRIAHELHDGIISQLTSVKLRFSNLLQQEKPIDRRLFEEGYHYLDETVQELRQTTHNLMPESVIQNSLPGAVQDFCRKADDEHATRVHFMTNGHYRPLEKIYELSIYRIVQELVQNALKYANANILIVQLNYHEHLLAITIEDDGVGFDPATVPHTGTGLKHIHERIKMLDSHMEILSGSGQGTTIYLEIPIIVSPKNS